MCRRSSQADRYPKLRAGSLGLAEFCDEPFRADVVDDVACRVVIAFSKEALDVAQGSGCNERKLEISGAGSVGVACSCKKTIAEAASVDAISRIPTFERVVRFWFGGTAPPDGAVVLLVGGTEVSERAGLAFAFGRRSHSFGVFEIDRLERITRRRAASLGLRGCGSVERCGEGVASYFFLHARIRAEGERCADLNARGAFREGLLKRIRS